MVADGARGHIADKGAAGLRVEIATIQARPFRIARALQAPHRRGCPPGPTADGIWIAVADRRVCAQHYTFGTGTG